MRSMILQHQRSQGHGAKVTKCISLYLLLLVDPLYVDDGELPEFTKSTKEKSERVEERLEALVNSDVGGLEVTGGG